MQRKSVRDLDVAGRRVLVRVDFNVPLEDGRVVDDIRLRASLPTIAYLKEQGARVILCSHLGRPGGMVVEEARLGPVAERLGQLLGSPVGYVRECIGPEVEAAVTRLRAGEVLLLENVRFHPEETENAPEFADSLASLAEIFVNDAFGAAHRSHASVVGVAQRLPAVTGLLMERELEVLGRILHDPGRPFAAVLGGAKISDKIAVLENLLDRVDLLLIGGGMAATFFKALGHEVGASMIEEDRVEFAGRVMAEAVERGVRLLLPRDLVLAREFAPDSPPRTVDAGRIPQDWRIMDVGPATVAEFREALAGFRTVLWNGPMGVFEFPAFSQGTKGLAEAIGGLDEVVTVVGGGSTAEAVASLDLADCMTHVSTGGGASLEFLEGEELVGVAALLQKRENSLEEVRRDRSWGKRLSGGLGENRA